MEELSYYEILEITQSATKTEIKKYLNALEEKDVQKAGRWEFTGNVAAESIRNKYLGKSIKHFF